MKKILIWKENHEGKSVGQIERIAQASEINSWTHNLKTKMESYPLNTPITDKPIVPEIVTANPGYYLKINEVKSQPEKWSKKGEEDSLIQPMTQPSWSNGTDILYDVNDIPTTVDEEGNPQLDSNYIYIAPQPDDSWTYHPAVEHSWEIVEDAEAKAAVDAEIALKQTVQSAINFGQQLLVDFAAENIKLGITQDGMTKTVRKNMAEVMSAISTGSLYDALDEIDAIPAEAKDDKYITDERLEAYKQRIQDYLGV